MKRPFCATVLLWLVLSFTAWSGLRLWTAIQWQRTLQEFGKPPGALYIGASAGVGLVTSLALLWGMWRGKAWRRAGLVGAVTLFSIWYWLDRLLFQMPRQNWPFDLGATIGLIIITCMCTFLPELKGFFGIFRGR